MTRTFYVRYRSGRWLFGREKSAFEVFDEKPAAVDRALAFMTRCREDVEIVILRKNGGVDRRLRRTQ